ncbi:hypothetical protein BJY21_001763 [Kineosphaera limosa]|nr:hypothetical protein [Kineosphaera limosa]NYE00579.1 hypothetical protein [Kineosphaera limosa]
MSAVTAHIVVGTKHRSDPGIQPRWVLLLHEGQNYAWHIVRLQLTTGDLPSTHPDDPPGVLWQASRNRDLIGEMALLVHLYAARTPEIVRAAARLAPLRKQRVDLAALSAPDRDQVDLLLDMARERGRELTLAATILPGSRLTEQALLELPDWELNIAHTEVTRTWSSDANGLVVTDLRVAAAADSDEDVYRPEGDEAQNASWEHELDEDAAAAAQAQGEAAEHAVAAADAPRPGRFGRRKHRAPAERDDRTISLAEFFGRGGHDRS